MKKFLSVLLVLSSLTAISQKSVLLRLKYEQGDNYLMTIEQKQNSGLQGGMNMIMNMNMVVTEAKADSFKTEARISSIALDMMQGEMSMSYDSNMKEEDLDQMGQMMKSQFDPMLQATIFSTYDTNGGSTVDKIEPAIPGMNQLADASGSINYPKEKISVGYSWSTEDEKQGMKMATTYKVREIENGMVYLDISGSVSGIGSGSISGTSEIEISSGLPIITQMDVSIAAQGLDMTVSSKITMTKM